MVRRLAPVVVLLALLPGTAGAQGIARDGRLTLRASAKGADRVCLKLRRERLTLGTACRLQPRSAWRPLHVRNQAAVGREPYAVALPPSVRVARIGSRRVPLVRAAGGRVRLLLSRPADDALARFFDARGRLVGVDPSVGGFRQVAEDVQVFGTREDGISAYAQAVLDPLPAEPDRQRTLTCVNGAHGSGGGGECEGEASLLPGCSEPDLVSAVLPPGLTRLRLTLRDGGELVFDAAALPPAFEGATVAAGLVPVGQAVTDVAALDATGTAVLGGRLDAPAAGQVCDDGPDGPTGADATLRPLAVPEPAVAATAGGRRALLADLPVLGTEAPRLCFGLDRDGAGLAAVDCRPAPVDAVPAITSRRDRAVATLLGPDAARVTARLRDGRELTVRARPPAGYAGAWRGRLRVALLRLPGRSKLVRLTVRDRRGTIVGVRRFNRPEPPRGPVGYA